MQVLHKKLMHEIDFETCCKSWTSRCWRHSLKDVQVEGLGAGAGAHGKGLKSPMPSNSNITFLLKW